MVTVIGIALIVYIAFFMFFLNYESKFRQLVYRLPILNLITVWFFNKNKEFIIWMAKRFKTFFIYLMKIEIDSEIEYALRMHSRWRIIHNDFPMILEKHFLNDAKEFYRAYRETIIEKRIVLNNQTYDHIEYWFEIKKSFKENLDFDSVISVHYLLLKFLEGDKAINKSNFFRFYCITHGLTIPKPDEFSRIYQYKEIARKIVFEKYKPSKTDFNNIIIFFESFQKASEKKVYKEWIHFLKNELENEIK